MWEGVVFRGGEVREGREGKGKGKGREGRRKTARGCGEERAGAYEPTHRYKYAEAERAAGPVSARRGFGFMGSVMRVLDPLCRIRQGGDTELQFVVQTHIPIREGAFLGRGRGGKPRGKFVRLGRPAAAQRHTQRHPHTQPPEKPRPRGRGR